ncbi:MAG TPA: NADH-quinone oxidoreductase subunit C [Acidimicrobiales bacterium]|nr:NADH-quinone oxidoreductase subunit C [Acidimicrobiales bacterium]
MSDATPAKDTTAKDTTAGTAKDQAGGSPPQPGADGDTSEAVETVPTVHGHPLVSSHDQPVVCCDRDGYLALMGALKDDGFEMCVDVCAVDYLSNAGRTLPAGVTPERFEVVVNLLSLRDHRRIRVRVQVPEADPAVATLFDLWPGSEAMEREAYDMFGIVFDGHPDLTRILMPEDWEGHPLRKDFAVGRVPVQFTEAPSTR